MGSEGASGGSSSSRAGGGSAGAAVAARASGSVGAAGQGDASVAGPPESRPGELAKQYRPGEHEQRIFARWQSGGAFHADPARVLRGEAKPYCVLIPPPNVTARLHLGHALNNTLQDVLVRARRMMGDEALWMPGTDHAGIATQTVVEKRLLAEHSKRRTDYARDEFVAHVQAFKDDYEKQITEQLRRLGASCDWPRQRFTMDAVCARAVREAFFRLFRDGLIYRGKRLVNWDPVTQTALADDEVEMREVDTFFWYLRYPIVDERGNGTGVFVAVATTRPETMLGDTAVAVNPRDPERARFIGARVRLPIAGRVVPIIGDDYVVMPDASSSDAKARYASGFLKVTPGHDPHDWQIGMRHGLDVINVMAPDASISKDHGWPAEDFAHSEKVGDARVLRELIGLDRYEARRLIVGWFREHGLLEASKPYVHAIGHSYRSHVPIEPYLSDQWYVRVTDDRLKGSAQRALALEQRSDESLTNWPESRPDRSAPTSRDCEGAVSGNARLPEPLADARGSLNHYLITFTTYGSWLHGDDRGSVDRQHNLPGAHLVGEDPARERHEFESLKHTPLLLDANARHVVQETVLEVALHRGWHVHCAHVRTNHVHVVVDASDSPERVMNDIKAYATRRLRERFPESAWERVWTRHGSTRYLNNPVAVEQATRYVFESQGPAMEPAPYRAPREQEPLPHGRGSLERSAAGDGAMRFHPDRYARSYEQWHDNLRDWCISRQLWWGHRIPVWRGPAGLAEAVEADANTALWRHEDGSVFVCLRVHDAGRVRELEALGFEQDPDVLDTWFSSALWPLSTLGWPDGDAAARDTGIADFPALLDAFNPTSVLCTAREIITLWVSRMVMFNRYFLGQGAKGRADGQGAIAIGSAAEQGRVPFREVFIHPVIQDGQGQKMSKSLGNGVDPLDVVESHGADALRLTLCQIATQTQDVRMPLEVVCPHTGQMFTPRMITTPAGYVVMAPVQDSPGGNGKKMVTVYGVVSGQARPTPEMPLAACSSPRFDAARNFCTKLWNASRFAMSMLPRDSGSLVPHGQTVRRDELGMADRWMVSRLAYATGELERALASYHFAQLAQVGYDVLWRDLCDWYIEAVKPTVASSGAQQAVLAHSVEAVLRLLHPMIPFVTEAIWEQWRYVSSRPIEGVDLAPPRKAGLLCTAGWPRIDASWHDIDAERWFDELRETVGAIREARSEHGVKPKHAVTLHPVGALAERLARSVEFSRLVSTLAGVGVVTLDKPGGLAVRVRALGEEHQLSNLAESSAGGDGSAERDRLGKRIAELEKNERALRTRLENPGYADRAPAKLVQQTRDQLASAVAELAEMRAALERLG